jgi:hypothetical protein
VAAITPDGHFAAGYSSTDGVSTRPVVWTRQNDNTWTSETWAYESNMLQAQIAALSADGTVAVGRIHRNVTGSQMFDAAYWKSKNELLQPDSHSTVSTYYTSISANGNYAGLYAGSGFYPYIHNLETNELIQLPDGGIINANTNDGCAVGISGTPQSGNTSPFVYSEKRGFMSFADFIETYLTSIELATYNKLLEIANGNSRIMSISSDGKNWALQYENTSTGVQEGYMLHLQENLTGIDNKPAKETLVGVYPTLTDGEITIDTALPASIKVVNSMGKTIAAYLCKAGKTKISLSGANGLYFVVVNNGATNSSHKIIKN